MNKKGKNKEKKKVEKQQVEIIYEDMENVETLMGFDEPEVLIDFVCLKCGCVDPVPEFIIGEFSYDLKKGEEVEMFCPKCNGTMRRKRA
jgi:hypothetical protein